MTTIDHRHKPGNIGQDSDRLRRESFTKPREIVQEESKPIQKEVNKLVVRIIQRGPVSSLIEWRLDETLNRGWVPNELIDGDQKVALSMLGSAIPYGLPLSQVLGSIKIESREVVEAMHREGLWAAQDFQKNPQSIARALMSACGLSASKIQSKIREFESNIKEATS